MSEERTEGPRWISRTVKFATLQWRLGSLPLALADAVAEAGEVPGVRLYTCGNMLEVSRSAARILDGLFARLGVPYPFTDAVVDKALVTLARPLYAHQEVAARWLIAEGGGILADAMGIGKSAAAAAAAESMADGKVVLIIGPRYVRDTWARELTALGLIASPRELGVARGTSPDIAQLTGTRWWFIHYQIAHAWIGHMRANAMGAPVVAIVDEAHWVRNPNSRMGSAVQALAGVARHRILLTGTPLPHRVSDLWALLTLVEGTAQWGSRFDFRVRYAGATSNGYGYQDHGATEAEELEARLAHVYIRRRAEDIPALDVPALTRQVLLVEPAADDPKKLVAAWDKLSWGACGLDPRALLAGLERGNLGRDTLAALGGLRKAAARVKVPTTVAHVAGLLASGASVVVFTWQRTTATAIANQALTAATRLMDDVPPEVYVVHGKVAQTVRDELVADFQETGGLLCATLDALREGVTLTAATHVVIHDLVWAPSDILQAEARIARIGQTRPCVASWVVARDCADELIARHLVAKVGVQLDATGDAAGREAFADAGLAAIFDVDAGVAMARALRAWEARTC